MTLLQICYILYFQAFTALLSMGSSSSRAISAAKNACFGTIYPLELALKAKNSVLATKLFFVTIVTIYLVIIIEYNNSKAFSLVTKCNILPKKSNFVTNCYKIVTNCYINLLHFVTHLNN